VLLMQLAVVEERELALPLPLGFFVAVMVT